MPLHDDDHGFGMTRGGPLRLAVGGLLAMAAALGIGRFVYTPILPSMLDALGWSPVDAGLVASANFLGYLVGAVAAGQGVFAGAPRRWLLIALVLSAATTAGMGAVAQMPVLLGLRFIGGVASAFVIVCASALVLERLALQGQKYLAAVHFAGVGIGVVVSAAVVATATAVGADWRQLWLVSGLIAAIAGTASALLIPAPQGAGQAHAAKPAVAARPGLASMTISYGLFGFGYVVTATFLVTIVRQTKEISAFEPWIWMVFGLVAIPSVSIWQWLGGRIGLMPAFVVACLLEAAGVAASVEWVTAPGIFASTLLLGGTFMGLTALGLMSGRALSPGRPQRALGFMTASFGCGQMVGPIVAGVLTEWTGSLRAATLMAAVALVMAALLAADAARRQATSRPVAI